MTTRSIAFDDAHGPQVSKALLSPVRTAARQQAAAELDHERSTPDAPFAGFLPDPAETDAAAFDRAKELIRLSRNAAGLPADDLAGLWRALVDTERDAIEADERDEKRRRLTSSPEDDE